MELSSIGVQAAAVQQPVPLHESEAAERAPDNEAAEATKGGALAQFPQAKAPLPSYAGTVVDTQA